MLHTKFRGNRPAGSREEELRRVFTIYGRGGLLVMSPASCHQIFISFHFLVPESFHKKFG